MIFGRLVAASTAAVIVVQLAGFAQRLHPFFDSLGHFRLHFAVLLAIGVALLLLTRRWRLAFAGALTLAASAFMMQPALCCEAPVPRVSLTLVQFNTLFSNPEPQLILDQIAAVKPDVVTLQEVSRNTRVIMDRLAADYPSQVLCRFQGVGDVAVLSKHPVTRTWCEAGSGLAGLRIQLDGREVAVASIHLHWPYPYGQAAQVEDLLRQLAALPQPIVMAGDFNAAPWSAAVTRLTEASGTSVAPGLRLTLKLAGGLSRFGIPPQPLLPIDHVLVPRGAAVSVSVGDDAGSDHLPLIAGIGLP